LIELGIAGCGTITQREHLSHLINIVGVDNIVLCDVSEDIVNKLAKKHRIAETFTDYHEFLEKGNFDAVIICTPYPFHYNHIVDAIKAEKHIFVEKPMCMTVKDAEKIVKTQRNTAGLVIQVGYQRTFDPAHKLVKERLQKMDDLRLVRAHHLQNAHRLAYSEKLTPFITGKISEEAKIALSEEVQRQVKEQFGEVTPLISSAYCHLLDVATHQIDYVRGLLGDPSRVLFSDIWGNEGSLCTISVLEYPNGMRCVFEQGQAHQRKYRDPQIVAYSASGTITMTEPMAGPCTVEVRRGTQEITNLNVISSYENNYKRELVHFIDCVRSRKIPRITVEDGLKAIKISATIIESYLQHRPIAL